MRRATAAFVGLLCCTVLLSGSAGLGREAVQQASVDEVFTAFWDAPNPKEAAKAADRIAASGVDFDAAWTRFEKGRSYSKSVSTGSLRWRNNTSDGTEMTYTVDVPDGYDPLTQYPVRFQLHGGIMNRTGNDADRPGARRLQGTLPEIEVFPMGWARASWWNANQVENLATILDRLKRTYNVDENQVYLTGSSDGGTGVYYMAMHEQTAWCCFLPLNGHMMVLANDSLGVQGELFLGNFLNKPFFIINGGRDRLYPTSAVEPYLRHIHNLGVEVVYRPQPLAGHDSSWWPEEKEFFEKFILEHPRDPFPDKLTWETERVDKFNRVHWLIIDRLGSEAGEATFKDPNLLELPRDIDFGIRVNSRTGKGNKLIDVLKGSNAEAIGLRKDDEIVQIDNAKIGSARDLVNKLQKQQVGAPIAIRVKRNGKSVDLQSTFQPGPLDSPPQPIYVRTKPSGRVDLVRTGNTVDVKTHGVKTYTLLISPARFDFAKPIKIVTNGHVSFEGLMKLDVATLAKWAARDNDRAMLFGAEIQVNVGASKSTM